MPQMSLTVDATKWSVLRRAWSTTPREPAFDLIPTMIDTGQSANEVKQGSARGKEESVLILGPIPGDIQFTPVIMAIANHPETRLRTADLQRREILETLEMLNGSAQDLTRATEPPWITNARPPIILLPTVHTRLMDLTKLRPPTDTLRVRISRRTHPAGPHNLTTLPTEPE